MIQQALLLVSPLLLLALVPVGCKVGPDYAAPPARIAGQWTTQDSPTNEPLGADDAWCLKTSCP